MLAVKYYYSFLVYMVDGCVMVTFFQIFFNIFVLIEMNCKS